MIDSDKLSLKALNMLIREELLLRNEGVFGDRLAALRPDEEGEGTDSPNNDNAPEESDEGSEESDEGSKTESHPEEEDDKKNKKGLKSLDKGTINTALNQLRNQKIDAKRFREAIVKAVKTIHKNAGPQRKNFAQKDAPIIQRIGKEVIKILSGDFSNLVRESKQNYYVSPEAYEVVCLLAKEKKSIKLSIVRNKK